MSVQFVNNMGSHSVHYVCTMYALAECSSIVSCILPNDGSTEPKHVAEFLVLLPM
jgi:hypothetical protein